MVGRLQSAPVSLYRAVCHSILLVISQSVYAATVRPSIQPSIHSKRQPVHAALALSKQSVLGTTPHPIVLQQPTFKPLAPVGMWCQLQSCATLQLETEQPAQTSKILFHFQNAMQISLVGLVLPSFATHTLPSMGQFLGKYYLRFTIQCQKLCSCAAFTSYERHLFAARSADVTGSSYEQYSRRPSSTARSFQ